MVISFVVAIAIVVLALVVVVVIVVETFSANWTLWLCEQMNLKSYNLNLKMKNSTQSYFVSTSVTRKLNKILPNF